MCNLFNRKFHSGIRQRPLASRLLLHMTSQNPPTTHKAARCTMHILCTNLTLSQKGTSRAPHAHQSARSKATRGVRTMPRWCEDCFHAKQATRGRRWCVSCGKSRHAGSRNVSRIISRSQFGTSSVFKSAGCSLGWHGSLAAWIDARQQSKHGIQLIFTFKSFSCWCVSEDPCATFVLLPSFVRAA